MAALAEKRHRASEGGDSEQPAGVRADWRGIATGVGCVSSEGPRLSQRKEAERQPNGVAFSR
jgi:riboflavin biosynthesis pyrimidine reductase